MLFLSKGEKQCQKQKSQSIVMESVLKIWVIVRWVLRSNADIPHLVMG
jgi:hypothetical protein